MKSSVAGLGGFTYVSSSAGNVPPGQEGAAEKFARRTLGKTGMQLPVITMGVMNTSNPALVRAALDAGFFFLDTAQGYQRGTNESIVYDVVLTAYNFRQKHAEEVKKAIARAAEAGLGVVAMKTIGGNVGGAYHNQAIDARAALKWALQDGNVHTVITGFTTFDQLELDLTVLKDFSLTKLERENLRKAALQSSFYCQGCGRCLTQCVGQLPIPDLMRASMYLYGYRNLVAAQDLLFSLALPASPCAECSACPVQCLNQWNVRERIRDVVRLREVPSEFIA